MMSTHQKEAEKQMTVLYINKKLHANCVKTSFPFSPWNTLFFIQIRHANA